MKRILGLIAGILLILGGIALILRDPADLSSLSLYTGPLTVESGAEDPDFDISVDSPVLIRKVEMYQYIAVGRDQYTRDFSERYERNLGAEKNDIYKNPQFPKGLESELFFGKVRIGDVLLGKEYLKNFSYPYFRGVISKHTRSSPRASRRRPCRRASPSSSGPFSWAA